MRKKYYISRQHLKTPLPQSRRNPLLMALIKILLNISVFPLSPLLFSIFITGQRATQRTRQLTSVGFHGVSFSFNFVL